jgi:DNA-binding CsgD family transcriptional regulator
VQSLSQNLSIQIISLINALAFVILSRILSRIMYKQLPITSNISEMLVSVKSLPICTIVFDVKADLVDMNKLASDFLKIDNLDDYLNKKSAIEIDYLKLSKIITKLKKGLSVFDEIISISSVDGKSMEIVFNACMLCGSQRVFLFQFFDVVAPMTAASRISINSRDSWKKNKRLILDSPTKCRLSLENEKGFSIDTIQQDLLTKLLIAHPILTETDAVICALILKDKTLKEIGKILNITRNNIYGSLKQIMQKLDVTSSRELHNKLCVYK